MDLSIYPSNALAYKLWKNLAFPRTGGSEQPPSRVSFESIIQERPSLRGVSSTVMAALATSAQVTMSTSKSQKPPQSRRKQRSPLSPHGPEETPDYCHTTHEMNTIINTSNHKTNNNNNNNSTHDDLSSWQQEVLSSKITLVLVNFHSPYSLLNSLRTWNQSGLLGMLDEKIAILNQASITERAICESFGVQVLRPKYMTIPAEHKRKPDVLTIASAFHHGLRLARNEHVLFLESDFTIDLTLSSERLYAELLGGVGLLSRGIPLVRLSSRRNMGSFSFQDCATQDFLLSNDPHDVLYRKRNWFRFYCPTKGQVVSKSKSKSKGKSKGQPRDKSKKDVLRLDQYVTDCLDLPALTHYKCFTSRDSSWSLNACLVQKRNILEKSYSFRLPITDYDRETLHSAAAIKQAYPVHTMSIPEIGVQFCSQKQVINKTNTNCPGSCMERRILIICLSLLLYSCTIS